MFQGELVLFGGGVEIASTLSLFKKKIFCLIFLGGSGQVFFWGGSLPL